LKTEGRGQQAEVRGQRSKGAVERGRVGAEDCGLREKSISDCGFRMSNGGFQILDLGLGRVVRSC